MINAGTIAAYLTLDTNKFEAGMKSANAQLTALKDGSLTTAQKIQGVGGALTTIGGTLTRNLTVPLVGAGVTAVKFATDYESAFAGVRKTVDATEEEYQQLSDSILDMSKRMPTAATEIAGVMEAAGQLGIEKDSLESFTETMVMLGDSTNLSANEAATALAKFANVTDMSAKDYGRLGSTIVELGNNFATTESDIVAMGTRLASTGNLVGLSQAQIMAVATALSSCGIEAEAGGSAVSKLLKQIDVAANTFAKSNTVIHSTGYSLRELELLADQDSSSFKKVAASLGLTSDELKNYMGHAKDLEAFSDVAGVTAEEFVAAWGEDAVGALGLFIDGLNDTERNGRTAVEILDEMGITEVRMSNAVLSLASSNGILTESTEMANKAWEENTALSHEAEQRYATFASQCAILWNQVKALGIELGQDLMPVAKDLVGTAGDIVSRFSSLDDGTKELIVKAGLLAAAVGPVSTAFGKVVGGVGSLITAFSSAGAAFTAAGGGIAGVGSALVSLITPAGLVVAGLAAVAAIGVAVYQSSKEARKGTEALGTAMSGAADYAKSFSNDIHTATGKMSDFASALNAGFDLNDIKSKISDVQDKITKITAKATSERRTLTQSEIDKLDEYYKKLRELTEQELAYYENNLSALQTIIENDFDMTADNAQKVLSEAQSYKGEAISLAWEAYEEEIALIAKTYDKESEEYKKGNAEAKQRYDERVKMIDESYAKITDSVSNSYSQQMVAAADWYKALSDYKMKISVLNDEYYQNEEHYADGIQGFFDKAKGWIHKHSNLFSDYTKRKNELDAQLAESWDNSAQQQIGTWLALVAEQETCGGEITEGTREMIDNICAVMENLPDETRESMKNTWLGMKKELEAACPELYAAAEGDATSIINAIDTALGIASPSRVMREKGRFTIQGFIQGMDSQSGAALTVISSIINSVKEKANSVNFTPVGQNVIGTVMTGMSNRQGAALTLIGGMMTSVRDKAGSISFLPVGQNDMNGVMTGLGNRKGAALTTIGSIMTSVKDRAGSVSFVPIGQNIISGMINGLNSGRASLMTTAQNIASNVSSVIKSALKINSPSRVMMEIGKFTAQGMELGLMKGAESLYDTASAISEETAEALAGITTSRLNVSVPVNDYGDKLDKLIDEVRRLADSQPTMEIDGRPFGRLVREYV